MKRIFAFSLFILSFVSVCQGNEFSYQCRDEVVSLQVDPAAVALESFDKTPIDTGFAQKDAAAEILYAVPERGRLVVRFDSAESAESFKSNKGAGVRIYPVYRYGKETHPTWTFDEIVLRLTNPDRESGFRRYCDSNGVHILDQSPYTPTRFTLRVPLTSEETVFDWIRSFETRAFTLWVEPNLYGGARLLGAPPNDPLYPNQIFHTIIDSLGAWDVTLGSSDIVVAVLDEGIDINHEDLAANIWQNPVEASGTPGADDDGNGLIDDVFGWDFTSGGGGDPDVTPSTSAFGAHGTSVAGVIAAVQNNSLGVTGIAPGIRVMSVRVATGSSVISSVAGNALEYSATHADVINLSWGGGAPNNTVLDAVDYAMEFGRAGRGTAVIAAAGNEIGDEVVFPARYTWAVAVAETSLDDQHHDGSAFDENLVMTAPSAFWTADNTGPNNGWDDPQDDYTGIFDGTSSSAPQASALVAMVLSRFPGMTAAEAVANVIASLDNPFPGIAPNDRFGKSPTMGYGRINARRAATLGGNYVDDRLEPNDSPETAAVIEGGFYPWLIQGVNPDYYRLDAIAGGRIDVRFEYLPSFGDIEISLVDANLQEVAASIDLTPGGTNRLGGSIVRGFKHVPFSTEPHYLVVNSPFGGAKPYFLDVEVTAADDAFEPNDNVGQATILTPGAGTTYGDLVMNGEDFYRVQLTDGQYLYGLLTFNHTKGDLAVQVLGPDGTTPLSGTTIPGTDEANYGEQFEPLQATETGPHYVRVYSERDETQREYGLHLAVLNAAPITVSGQDDAFEDNDMVAMATPIGEGFYPNLAVDNFAPEVRDVFTVTVPAGKQGRLTVGYSNSAADLDLRVFDDEVTMTTPSAVDPISKSSRFLFEVESAVLPVYQEDTSFWIDIRRTFEGQQQPTSYRFAVEFLDPPENPWVAFWRFLEGDAGGPADSLAIRDWRGPELSHAPSGYAGLSWATAPTGEFMPGSDQVALDCSSGGIYYPNNGDHEELELPADEPFTVWARFSSTSAGVPRMIAGVPGVWEFSVNASDRLEAMIFASPLDETHEGPAIPPTGWTEAALVWDPDNSQVRLIGNNGGVLLESTLPTGLNFTGTGAFHVGSWTGGARPLGMVEQARLYRKALTLQEIQAFSTQSFPSAQANWRLYE